MQRKKRKHGRGRGIQAETSLDAYRRYLAAVATVCAYASGHPDPDEVLAAVRVLQADVPRTLKRLGWHAEQIETCPSLLRRR